MKPEPRHFRCFTMHAERLEVDRVWSHTDALLRRLERRGGRATLFVHPFSAIEAGADLGPKLRSLVERGHEIAQHTHYYAPRPAGSTAKPVSLVDPENVVRCLDRDLAYLREAGMDTARVRGRWLGHHDRRDRLAPGARVLPTTRACARSRSPTSTPARSPATDGSGRPTRTAWFVCPTTTPVARSFRRGSWPISIGVGRYDMAYIHDYDLLRPRYSDGCRVVVRPLGAGSVEDGRRDRQARAAEPLPSA